MPAEPRGCLTAILALFGIRLPRPSAPSRLPYRVRDDFLSSAELSFYRVLTTALGGEFVVCPKVNLADVFFVPRSPDQQSHRNRIDRKHVDFLLVEPETMRPALGVELDDASHRRAERQERDRLVDDVFEAAGLPLLRVPVASGYAPRDLERLVREALDNRKVAGRVTPATGPDDTPVCPRCEAPMLRRTAKTGERRGEMFWGCRNYPKCRETVPG